MAKQHEIVAVESDVKGKYDKIEQETTNTFRHKELFDGHTKRYRSLKEGDDYRPATPDEEKRRATTVSEKVNYFKDSWVKLVDLTYTKEKTNVEAKADLVVEDDNGNAVVIAKDVPATMLLNLETSLKRLRSVYDAAPTLDNNIHWDKDPNQVDVYKSKESITYATRKIDKALVLYPHVEKDGKFLPAQTQLIKEDVNSGEWITQYESGRWTSLEKSEKLSKIDALIVAAKKARMRANDCEAKKSYIGKEIMNFINS